MDFTVKVRSVISKVVGTVAQLINPYLPHTQTFIYQYLKNAKKFEHIVITKEIQNLALFPHDSVCLVESRIALEQLVDKIFYKISGHWVIEEFRYKAIVRERKAQIMHAHFGWSAPIGLSLKEALGIPLVTTFYGLDISAIPQDKYWLAFYKKLFREGDVFLVEGSHMKSLLTDIGCEPEKIRIQKVGVDVEAIQFTPRVMPKSDSAVRILMCGRFTEKKGIPYGIRAFDKILKHLKARGITAELRIIGDGEDRIEIEKLIAELSLDKAVVLLGNLQHEGFIAELQRAHIFLAPSVTAANGDSEGGAPTVLLEAQASGLPVISTYHADIPEVVVDNVSGLLAKERDVDDLAEKLMFVVEKPDCWVEMGVSGRKHIEDNHDIIKLVLRLEQLYSELAFSDEKFSG
jgi:colanic acid/amylovoran biosynthesis glycosyltransferase